MYCPFHGKKLTNEKELKDADSIINRKCGIYESVGVCKHDKGSHKVFITDKQSVEQLGEIEVVLS